MAQPPKRQQESDDLWTIIFNRNCHHIVSPVEFKIPGWLHEKSRLLQLPIYPKRQLDAKFEFGLIILHFIK